MSASAEAKATGLSQNEKKSRSESHLDSSLSAPKSTSSKNEAPAREAGPSRSESSIRPRKAKRLKGLYNDDYRRLFNESIYEANHKRFEEDPPLLEPSQIGASYWDSREKEGFFNALTRFGKDGAGEIAREIETKSEFQVREYLLLLQDGFREYNINSQSCKGLEPYASFPAAYEISDECAEALALAGEAVDLHTEKSVTNAEKERHGDLWLLDQDIAEEVEDEINKQKAVLVVDDVEGVGQELGSQEEGKGTPSSQDENLLDALPAARLLKLRTWLLLSERLFMNSGNPAESDNWRNIADENERPSIYHMAFTDFYRLTVSLTKRLVQASIFQSMSRVRAEDWRKSHETRPSVARQDVRIALQILGMKKNSKEFWAKMSKRCRVNVYIDPPENNSKGSAPPALSYDDVESRLLGLRSPTVLSPIPRVLALSVVSSTPALDHERPGESAEEASDPSSREATPDSMRSDQLEPPAHRTRREREKDEDSYAELLDQRKSYEEEQMLRSIARLSPLGLPAPDLDHAPPVGARRRSLEELADWREGFDYRAEWEVYGTVLRPDIFSKRNVGEGGSEKQGSPAQPELNVGYVPLESPRKRKFSRSESSDEALETDDNDGEDDAVMSDTSSKRRTLPSRKSREAAAQKLEGIEYPVEEMSVSEDSASLSE